MSYEVTEPYIVEDENGDLCSQHKKLEEAVESLINTANDIDANDSGSLGSGAGSMVSLIVSRAEFDVTADELYVMHESPEWQRIQEELREGREAKEKLKLVPVNENGCLLFVGAKVAVWKHGESFMAEVSLIDKGFDDLIRTMMVRDNGNAYFVQPGDCYQTIESIKKEESN